MTRYERVKAAVRNDDPKDIARMMCDNCGDCDECVARNVGYTCYKGNNACLQWLNDEDD